MQLLEIHIYGYGKLENLKITDLANLQVFYGENEAGKSTIMAFIHGVLFGFPTKQQAELRYEPKKNPKYGGLIKARFPAYGMAVIERVKGKAAGDVTVTLEDGTIGNEELLAELLGGMDKSMFQAIFSFNLQGLQNIHTLKGEELGKYLFSAGALGTDKLFHAENQLLKEMELRFKPNGRKPQLNQKLKDLRQTYEALTKAEAENEEYDELLATKERTESRLSKWQTDIKELEHQVYKHTELERVLPLIVEEKQLEEKLADVGEIRFPPDGLSRLDRLKEQKQQVQARLSYLAERIKLIEKEVERLRPDEALLSHEQEVTLQLDHYSYYVQFSQEQERLQTRLREMNEEIERIQDSLHVSFNEEKIASINTSVAVKEVAEELQLKEQQHRERKLTLDERFQDEKRVLEELEKTAGELKGNLLDEEYEAELENQLKTAEEGERLKSEHRRIHEQLEAMKKNSKQSQANEKRQSRQMLLIGILFLFLIVIGWLNSEWVLTGTGMVGLLIVLFMSVRFSRTNINEEAYTALAAREQELRDQLKRSKGSNVTLVKETLDQDKQRKIELREVMARLQQQTHRYEQVIQSFESWEAEGNEIRQGKLALTEQLGLPEEMGKRKIYDAFVLVEKLKQLFRERSRVKTQLLETTAKRQELHEKYVILAQRFLNKRDLKVQDIVLLLRKKLRDEVDRQLNFREASAKWTELGEEAQQLEKELQQLQDEEARLLELAKVDDVESFRKSGVLAEQITDWKERLANISLQLEMAGVSLQEREKVKLGLNPREERKALETKLEEHKRSQTQLQDLLAETKHRIGLLEEGGLYAELLHKYVQMKYEFEEEAKEWAQFALAKELLSQTIASYKTDRLPKLLLKASEYLRFLTNDEYLRMMPQESGSGFLIERNDHTMFLANELSQATAEQVYVSLRLALIESLYSLYPFPMIIDDSFVNFDENRAKRMFVLLRRFTKNQILFFTCHKHVLDEFHENEIIRMNFMKVKSSD